MSDNLMNYKFYTLKTSYLQAHAWRNGTGEGVLNQEETIEGEVKYFF